MPPTSGHGPSTADGELRGRRSPEGGALCLQNSQGSPEGPICSREGGSRYGPSWGHGRLTAETEARCFTHRKDSAPATVCGHLYL